MPPVILASQSPRRREFLMKLGMKFDVVPNTGPEPKRKEGEGAADYALRLAWNKAETVARGRPPGALVLAADTVVALGDQVFGKPADAEDWKRTLRALSGTTHEVITAICVARAGPEPNPQVTTVTSKVTFRPLSEQEIDWYVALGEGKDKAGGYASQGAAAAFITRIDGSYSNVVGLPLAETLDLLKREGALMPWEDPRPRWP